MENICVINDKKMVTQNNIFPKYSIETKIFNNQKEMFSL